MASVGHVAIGMAAARLHGGARLAGTASVASMVWWSALSLLPDADVIGFAFGIRYADPWGHRGATHSFAFAVLVGVAIFLFELLWKGRRSRLRAAAGRAARSGTIAAVVVASHALLDTLTDGGLGCALFWPLDNTRYFAPWNPIPVAPIGLDFISRRGALVVAVETMLFAPLLAYALYPALVRALPRRM